MTQQLLFNEAEIAAQPKSEHYVFERLTALDLFEKSTCLYLPEFVDSIVWRAGFQGTEEEKTALVQSLSDQLLQRFMTDGEFADRVGRSEDPRIELGQLIRKGMK